MAEQENGTVRAYVVFARVKEVNGPELIAEVGSFRAASALLALRDGISAWGRDASSRDDDLLLGEPFGWFAVAERNLVELPVERSVQTTLRIGGREFVVDGTS